MSLAAVGAVLETLRAMRNAVARAQVADTAAVAALERSDLAAINHWLSVTRLRTGVAVSIAMPLLGLIGGLDLPWLAITLVCASVAAMSWIYERQLKRGCDLIRLVYVQLAVDGLAISAGLAAMGPSRQLFGCFYLMIIVPATMVSGTCGVVMTVFSSACYGALLALGATGDVLQASVWAYFVVPVFIFGLVANQSFFYKRNLRAKNRHLAHTSERLAEANAELTATAEVALGLLEVSRALAASLDLGVVIDRLHTVASERLKTDWCATILVDPTSPAGYRLLASRGLGGAADAAVSSGFWDFGALVAAESVLEITDVATGPGARALQGWKIASGIFTAMRYGNRTVGIFATGSRTETGRLAPFQRELAVGIANQAAVAIENATLHTRQREEGEISSALLQISEFLDANLDADDRLERLCALACRLVGCDFANVLLYDSEKDAFRIAAGSDVGAPHYLEEARQLELHVSDFPILREMVRRGYAEACEGDGNALIDSPWMARWALRAVLAVPLSLRNETIGALLIGSHEHARPFANKTRRLLSGIAYQTALALENGRLVHNLRAANNLKSEFISTMSHELRTPLNAIIGYNELIREGEFGPVTERQQEICGKVLESSRQLLELIQATLDVSRLESGAFPISLAPTDVGALLEELRTQIPASWVKPGVRLEFAADDALPRIQSDHPKLKMIVRNLVHNALKFTDRGFVQVHATIGDDRSTLAITVRDTGIGISAESQAIIFDMFRQVDGSDRRLHDGVGLGLYIVRRLTALLGGTIALDSEIGAGSCFTLSFPLVDAVPSHGPSRRAPTVPAQALSA